MFSLVVFEPPIFMSLFLLHYIALAYRGICTFCNWITADYLAIMKLENEVERLHILVTKFYDHAVITIFYAKHVSSQIHTFRCWQLLESAEENNPTLTS